MKNISVIIATIVILSSIALAGPGELGSDGADTGAWADDAKQFLREKKEFKEALNKSKSKDPNVRAEGNKRMKEIHETKQREAIQKSAPKGGGGPDPATQADMK